MKQEIEEVKTIEEAWERIMASREQIKKEAEILTYKYLAEKRFQENLPR